MESKNEKKMTHSEFIAKLEEKVENLKGGLDALMSAKTTGNRKQVAYWVGKNAHDLVELGKLCMGEVVAEKLAKVKGGIITL